MGNLQLEPEFYVDLYGAIHHGTITIEGKPDEPVQKILLPNQVVLPGFVNSHSHVFQRALRGIVEENQPQKEGGNFWSWRETMYRLALDIGKDELSAIAELSYLEMIEAGFTHVGEFHYLHHDKSGTAYDPNLALSFELIKAAHKSGINLCLLECAYHRHNFLEKARPEQRRFTFAHVEDYVHFVKEALSFRSDTVQIGLALHSVRTVPESWFKPINDFAIAENLKLHIHASEQIKEVEDCRAVTGMTPIELLDKHGLLAPHVTLIHAIHLSDNDHDLIAKKKPIVCICPSTEMNLGDGLIELSRFVKNDVKLCIGTDQHVRFDPFSEARSLEEIERLRTRQRKIINQQGYLHKPLLKCLSKTGLDSLVTKSTTMWAQRSSNWISVELPPEYLWHGPLRALDAMMLSHHPGKIKNVIVNGELVLQDGMLINKNKSYLIKELRNFFKKYSH